MLLDGIRGRPLVPRSRLALPWQLIRRATGRLGWGVADQAMSSLSNFAVNIYIARSLGAVSYGAFGLAYVTYSFALNASRGLGTDPLLTRFSGAEVRPWRRAVAGCTATALVTGVVAGAVVLAAAVLMHGTVRGAFIALGLTLPALLLQDSWRFCFFAIGRGYHALLNDTIWTVVLVPALVVLKRTGHASVFWFVLAWGLSAAAGAVVGPLQSGVMPRLSRVPAWISAHRDLGPRYLLEGTANSSSTQLRNYAVGLLLGLAAVGYVQGASTLMGPFMVIFFGMGLVTLPEAARVLRRSPKHLPLFCMLVSGGLALAGLVWVVVLLVSLPRGLGHLMLGSLWRPTYPLVLPLGISVIGGCISAGAGAGLHALGASKRSLRAMVQSSALFVILGSVGARLGGASGTMDGAAISGMIGAALFWWQLRLGLRDYRKGTVAGRARHRKRQGQLAAALPSERESA
jgi:O-antigen/teichoic acid export membrane protein